MTERRRTSPTAAVSDVPDAGRVQLAFRLASVALLVPIVFTAIHHAVTNWVPIGDSAYFTARSLDVGTSHTPLVGAWSSGSLEYAHPINSLGPMELYLLAPFTHLAPAAGTAIGVALVQLAAVVTIVALLRRTYGTRGALAGMVGVAWLVWAMGSENLVAAVQHPYLILPFAAAIVATIATLAGDRWALLALVVFGSLCAQTHLSYPILIAALLVIAGIGQFNWWRCGDADERSATLSATLVAIATGFVLWTPPLIDQFFGSGNLVAALTQGGGDEYPTGFRLGTRIIATVTTDPATLGPRGFVAYNLRDQIASGTRGAAFLVFIAACVAFTGWAYRTRRMTAFYWSLVLTAIMITMIINASLIPGSIFGYRVDNYRWIWSWLGVGGAAVWLGIDSLLSDPARPSSGRWRRVGPAALAVLIAALGVWNLVPRGMPNMGTYRDATDDVSAVSTQLDAYLDAHDVTGPIVIDDTHLFFGAPYNYPVMVVLQRHNIAVRFPEKIYGYRFGSDRVADGTEPLRLTIWVDVGALERRDDLIAFSSVWQPAGLELVENTPGVDG